MLDVACDHFWDTCLQLQHDTVCGCLFWAYVCVGMVKLHTKASFHHHQAQGQVNKRLKAPRDPLPPAGSLLDSVTERASGGTPICVR